MRSGKLQAVLVEVRVGLVGCDEGREVGFGVGGQKPDNGGSVAGGVARGGPDVAFIAALKAVGESLARQGRVVAAWAVGDGNVRDLYGDDRVGGRRGDRGRVA
jgi:hypothetical protein